MNFKTFKDVVSKQFNMMSQHNMFRTTVDKDALWDTYLASFPEGTNPIHKERTEHDCTACKQFIRAVGSAVAIIDNKLVSIWDIDIQDSPYQAVANALSALVKAQPIENVFLHPERTAGVDKNFGMFLGDTQTFEHFFVNIPNGTKGTKNFYRAGKDIGPILSESRAQHDVLRRSLDEITDDSIDTVLELIAQNALYRGEEKKSLLETFKKMKAEYNKLGDADKDLYVWSQLDGPHTFVCKIRNDVVGTLLVDLSNGEDLEGAVASFEAKVAPTNYKRPTSLITPKMVENAKQKIEELGLTSALGRRYAVLPDITVNNVLFADRTAKKVMEGSIFDGLATAPSINTKKLDAVQEVTIEKFIADILPKADTIEVMLENGHVGNLMSLIAPEDPTAGLLFKWPNNFSWSYHGQVADSDIRQAVQAAGGRVDGVFRFSHSWNHNKRNASLMDLHVFMPGCGVKPQNGSHDTYGNQERVGWNHRTHSASGGIQDVDYTSPAPVGYIPVENITFPALNRMPEGTYICKIHNWHLRPPTDGGFKAEIECGGNLYQYEYDKPLKDKEWVTVAEVTLKDGVFTIKHHLPESNSAKKVWGLQTQAFHRVKVVMLSPNHWDGGGVGNRHYFFILDGCANDGQPRGIFNEFLSGALEPHRKVFEMVGSKIVVPESAEQLSGLGFSSTQRNKVLCKVKGSFSRVVKIVF